MSDDDELQRARFSRAEPAHFEWQTTGSYTADREAALLAGVRAPGGRLLELGCGQGGNLFHLDGQARVLHGIDRSAERLTFARSHARRAQRLVVADAGSLPYRDGSFEGVLIRDVLHHVASRPRVLAEAWRVLAPGGALFLIEPNGANPLIFAFAALVPAERGMLRSSRARLVVELEALPGHGPIESDMAQPLPLERVMLNPAWGLPALADASWARGALGLAERVSTRAMPRRLWAYARAWTTKLR